MMAYHHKVICAAQNGRSDEHERYVRKSQCSCKEDQPPKARQYQRVPDSEIQQKAIHKNLDLPVDDKSTIEHRDNGIIRTCVRWRT